MAVTAQDSFPFAQPHPVIGLSAERDFIDALLDIHGGDYRRAMRELLLDADFLRGQLATAHNLMSHGFGRGWTPKYERI